MTESASTNEILLATARWGARLFRQNTGMGWVGKVKRKRGSKTIEIENARPLHAGLCLGSSDIIGGVPVEITAEMIGKTVMVFTAVEVKEEGVATTKEQHDFLKAIEAAGGFAVLARARGGVSAADAGIGGLADCIAELKRKRPIQGRT